MVDQRRNPEELLARIQEQERQESRGKLKIYLGAAPGVGKTYEMLHDALGMRSKGLDVVAGIAESHGREDIAQMLRNFEILPRRKIDYHGKTFYEFDLDAALHRHPALILVDEMAHTNAPDSRHAKRWQDIQELLARGIDVYTTLNVQHIESLKDDVAQIIKAPIKETVPDFMIERAETIELVDLPPEELLKRLEEGKVYIPKQAELALEHFFRKGNLIALRELALSTTAKRVGTDVLLYRQGERIKHIWPIRDKILVCVGPRPDSLQLIRAAKRMANSLKAMWMAIYIDTPRVEPGSEERNKAIQNLRLAELLGADTHVISGFDIVKEIMSFAHDQNVTQIMIWKHLGKRWRDWFWCDLADEIVRNSGEIDVYIMTGHMPEHRFSKSKLFKPSAWKTYTIALVMVGIATAINCFLYPMVDLSSIILIYLVSVAIVALFGRIGPSILASILSVVAYDFFFIKPFNTFAIPHLGYFFTLVGMLIIAQVISHLTIMVRRQAESSRMIQLQTTALYTFSRKLISTRGVNKLLALGIPYLSSAFNSDIMVLLPGKAGLEIHSSYPAQPKLNDKELSIAQWVYDLGQAAGLSTDTLSFSEALYLPLLGSSTPVGVLRIQPRSQELFTPDQRGLLESCTNQLALALEVEHLQENSRLKELELETERARTSLLKSIFHDLSMPLQRVIKAVNHLKKVDTKKLASVEKDIDDEIYKLYRLNNNLYQVIQLDSHNLKLKKELSSLAKLIQKVIKMSAKLVQDRPIKSEIPTKVPLIMMDSELIQEVLMNLFDNAIKFSPPKSPIQVFVTINLKHVTVSIEDFGPGIMPEEKTKLFNKFYRGQKVVAEHGLGLGLAICQKIIAAHEGTIWVENIENQGAAFRFTLPLPEQEPPQN